eukprot:CAMPEP_0197555168 /NCGR_PEP_ID=MMETSP1320-20131121/12827_1 /TAXON_ID=91990 /ORGANISM="Bolidomonas sp., Strain RCC2347" /LENGTH=142 /DNA_ID=CAMNT_0043116147 /DNA_START=138 /DNA_END=563 /DNA_ORIENTATION=-
MIPAAFRSVLGVFGVSVPSKIPSISEEKPMLIPRSSLKYLYGFTIFASLAGGLVLLRALESLGGSSSMARVEAQRNMSPEDREIFEAQSMAIAEMRRSAKERTPLENLRAAGLATHEFMVPPSQRRMEEAEENWRNYMKRQT